MPGPADELIRWAARAAAPPGTDRDLLARFAAGRDEAAFAELVRRHGPVVFGVCHRVVGHRQDAEDAFQAVFLVLARKADRVGRPDALGGWLYAVAVRVARKARRSADRRRGREIAVHPVPDVPAVNAEPSPELATVIDEELSTLPAWYRDAVVLCDLRGQSRAEAAAALGIPEGTLSSRLNAGRKKLAARLTRRGLGVPATGLATILGADVAAVSPRLQASAVDAALAGSAGGAVPANIETLAVEWGWGVGKAKLLAAVVAAAGVGVGTVVGMSGDKPTAESAKPAAQNPKPVTEAKTEPPADKPADAGKPRLTHALEVPAAVESGPVWSADGRVFAVRFGDEFVVYDGETLKVKKRYPVGRHSPTLLGFADGPTLVAYRRGRGTIHAISQLDFWNTETGGEYGRDFNPALGTPQHMLPDGKTLIATIFVGGRANMSSREFGRSGPGDRGAVPPPIENATAVFRFMDLTVPEGEARMVNVDGDVAGWAAFPDGKRLLVTVVQPDATWVVRCYTVADSKVVWERSFKGLTTDPRFGNRIHVAPDGKTATVGIAFPAPKAKPQPGDRQRSSIRPQQNSDSLYEVLVLDTSSGETRCRLAGSGDGHVFASSMSHDGRLVVGRFSESESGPRSSYHTRLWDARTGVVLKSWNAPSWTLLSPAKPTLLIIEGFQEPTGKRDVNGGESSEQWSVMGLWDVSSLLK